MLIMVIISIISLIFFMCIIRIKLINTLKSVGSRVIYELDYKKPLAILYVIPMESILGKPQVVPVGDT